LAVFLFMSFPDLVSLVKGEALSGLSSIGISLLFLPIGLAAIGLIASALTSKVSR
jgi:hypothetical protein